MNKMLVSRSPRLLVGVSTNVRFLVLPVFLRLVNVERLDLTGVPTIRLNERCSRVGV